MRDPRRAHQTGRVLIVEPHDDSRAMYAAYFTWAGFQVTAVRTAVGALHVMSHQRQDAVITCLRLRGMDGFALCEAVGARVVTSPVPVIAVSTSLSDYERATWQRKFAAVLMKPCLPDALFDCVQDALATPNLRHGRKAARGEPDLRLASS